MTNHSQPTLNDVQFAYDISLRYAPVIEDCLNSKVLSLPPLELILLHKDIFNDPEFSQRMRSARKAFLAEHPEIAGAQAQLIECKYDLMRMVEWVYAPTTCFHSDGWKRPRGHLMT
jgi:hypothetical protein